MKFSKKMNCKMKSTLSYYNQLLLKLNFHILKQHKENNKNKMFLKSSKPRLYTSMPEKDNIEVTGEGRSKC